MLLDAELGVPDKKLLDEGVLEDEERLEDEEALLDESELVGERVPLEDGVPSDDGLLEPPETKLLADEGLLLNDASLPEELPPEEASPDEPPLPEGKPPDEPPSPEDIPSEEPLTGGGPLPDAVPITADEELSPHIGLSLEEGPPLEK